LLFRGLKIVKEVEAKLYTITLLYQVNALDDIQCILRVKICSPFCFKSDTTNTHILELIKHTTDDHIDLSGLRLALLKAEKIANMTEEIHTQIMKIFRRLLQSIQHCPVRES
jgi:hypothetical protein